jgi:hypothetical protein
MQTAVCYTRGVGNRIDKNKRKQVEDAEAARAGLAILARLVARVHMAHAEGLSNPERDDTDISSSSIKQASDDDNP